MPSQKQQFSFPGYSTEQLLAIAYGTFLELGWNPKYAGPNAIIGYTPRSWKKKDDEIVVGAGDEILIITSSLVHNESFDLMGKNKKHIKEFITAFEKIKSSDTKPGWQEQVRALREQTVETVTEEAKRAEEVDKVMNFSGSNLYATYTIIGINVLVFILMAMDGAGVFTADGLTQIKWGSNFTPLTLSGDWWRLITCMFIHFGIIHLVMNTYALYMAGTFLEPMLGKVKYIVAYLCTGIIASLASLWWHKEGVNSAGASGAIFGLYGVFLALLLTNLIPKHIRTSLLQSIGLFVVFNLVYGMKSGIDNAAHAGGLLSGIVIGFVVYPILKSGNNKGKFVLTGIIAATILAAWFFINNPGEKPGAEGRKRALNEIKERAFPDSEKFFNSFNEIAESEQKMDAMKTDGITDHGKWIEKNEVSMNKELETVTNIITSMKRYDVSETAKAKVNKVEELLDAQKEEMSIIKQLAQDNNPANQLKLAEIREKQRGILEALKKLNEGS